MAGTLFDPERVVAADGHPGDASRAEVVEGDVLVLGIAHEELRVDSPLRSRAAPRHISAAKSFGLSTVRPSPHRQPEPSIWTWDAPLPHGKGRTGCPWPLEPGCLYERKSVTRTTYRAVTFARPGRGFVLCFALLVKLGVPRHSPKSTKARTFGDSSRLLAKTRFTSRGGSTTLKRAARAGRKPTLVGSSPKRGPQCLRRLRPVLDRRLFVHAYPGVNFELLGFAVLCECPTPRTPIRARHVNSVVPDQRVATTPESGIGPRRIATSASAIGNSFVSLETSSETVTSG